MLRRSAVHEALMSFLESSQRWFIALRYDGQREKCTGFLRQNLKEGHMWQRVEAVPVGCIIHEAKRARLLRRSVRSEQIIEFPACTADSLARRQRT